MEVMVQIHKEDSIPGDGLYRIEIYIEDPLCLGTETKISDYVVSGGELNEKMSEIWEWAQGVTVLVDNWKVSTGSGGIELSPASTSSEGSEPTMQPSHKPPVLRGRSERKAEPGEGRAGLRLVYSADRDPEGPKETD